MNKFKIGDQVRCVDAGKGTYIKTGNIYTVRECDGEYITLVGYHIEFFIGSFEPVVVNTPIGIAPEEVAKALLQGKALEYYHDGAWHKLLQPKSVAVSFMESGVFRYAAETMDYYGTEIPKPSIKPLDTADVLYWTDIRRAKVERSFQSRSGMLYWDTPEQAQEALTVILKPFGIIPQPLDERLVQEQPR